MKSFFLISLFSFSLIYSHPKATYEDIVCRAAIDIGSGKIGILVAEVNIKTNKIARILFSDIAKLPLRLSLEKTGEFNEEIQKNFLKPFRNLKKKHLFIVLNPILPLQQKPFVYQKMEKKLQIESMKSWKFLLRLFLKKKKAS